MESTVILDKYWNIFLRYFSCYYPLKKEFIKEWQDELDWHAISKNTQIEWNEDFITEYEYKFLWHELAWNESIIWTLELIEKFKKRLDWYYLGQNINLPLSEAFLDKYSKKINYIVDTNPNLTEALRTKYKFSVFPDRRNNNSVTNEINEATDLDVYFQNLTPYNYSFELYEKVFLPIIESQGLDKIFAEKFDYKQRYFSFTCKRNDIYGLTPEFVIIDEKELLNKAQNADGFFEIDKEIELKNGSLQEGKERLLEVHRLSVDMKLYSKFKLLVSENVKHVLLQFKLPKHIFYPVKLHHKKIKSDVQYYIFQIEQNTLLNNLNYQKSEFYYKLYGDDYSKFPFSDTVNNYEELKVWERAFLDEKKIGYPRLKPKVFYMKSEIDYDVFSFESDIIVNEFVKDALEKNFKNQMDFHSFQLMPIRINQEKYDAKKQNQPSVNIHNKPMYALTEIELFYQAKMERLEALQAHIAIDDFTQDDIFKTKELELNVIFPPNFKEKLLAKKIKVRGFKMLKPMDFYMENEYANRYAETYKSIVIATDGCGDTINLILEKDSDYLLQNALYRCYHETGEVKKISL